MVEGENITRAVIDVLETEGFPYMLVGSFSSNMYGIARSTKDADFVVDVADRTIMPRLFKALDHLLEFDPQASFEGLTGSVRHEATARSYPFRIEFFERRARHPSTVFGCEVWIPTPEDVVIQKLRWAREKDRADARDVIAVQGGALDHAHIQDWCRRLGILDRYQAVMASVPEI